METALTALDEAEHAPRGTGELRGALRVAASSSFTERALIRRLDEFLRRNPKGARGYTMSRGPAVAKPLASGLPLSSGIGALLLFHYPTSWNHFLADPGDFIPNSAAGDAPHAADDQVARQQNAVEGVDYDLNNLTHVWLETKIGTVKSARKIMSV